MDWQNYIERDPRIMMGKPVFKGTRLTVEFILERLGQGANEQELLDNYVGLRPEHLRAAQAFAAEDEILSPFREQVAQSNMSDEELEKFFHDELQAYRQEKRENLS